MLGGLVTAAVLGNSVVATSTARAASTDDFSALRAKWLTVLTGGDGIDTADPDISARVAAITDAANTAWASMDTSADRTYLWASEKDITTQVGEAATTYTRLASMGLAYRTHGSALEGNSDLGSDIADGLGWLYDNVYNETVPETGNWWYWSIGIPQQLLQLLVFTYDLLSADQLATYLKPVLKYSDLPGQTGANLVWISDCLARAGVLLGDSARVSYACDQILAVLPYVTQGDGFYTDGSFIQHAHFAYTGSYGISLLSVLAPFLNWVSDSPWQVTDPAVANVSKWVHDSFAPLMYHGHMMDMVRGREISRYYSTDLDAGHLVISGVLDVIEFASADDQTAFGSMIKQWIDPTYYAGVDDLGRTTPVSVYYITRAKAILADTSIPVGTTPDSYRQYAAMDRAVQWRSDCAIGISMSSNRIATYESINDENLHGWYTGSGMTYLYNADRSQYTGDFWPTVNPYRLPGTTVEASQLADSQGQGYLAPDGDAGGTLINGKYGTSGMRLDQPGGLTGIKSWFLLGDKVVMLGSDIASTGPNTVESIVENRKLNSAGDNPITINDRTMPSTTGWSAVIKNARTVHLTGSVPGSDIGYYFPRPVVLHALRESRTGRWRDINDASTTPITANYATIWLDHGIQPSGANYAYAMMPGISNERLRAYADAPDFTVLANNGDVQAVCDHHLKITAAQFWANHLTTAGEITSDHRSAVMIATSQHGLHVAVSDPSQSGQTVHLEIRHRASTIERVDPGIIVTQLSPTIKLEVTPTAGQTSTATFSTTRNATN